MSAITIKDIARICGVGVSTVSRALNNHPDINPDTKEKIMKVVEEYDFSPNTSARNLKITESNTIAVLVKGLSNPFFTKMIDVIEEEIQENHFSMELRHVDEKNDEVEVALDLVREKKLKGIIFLGGILGHSAEKLSRLSVPYVLATISMDDDMGEGSSVSVDDFLESRKMTEYLVSKGHSKIAFMGAAVTDTSIGQLRFLGYLDALDRHNIEKNSSLIWHSEDESDTYSMENGYRMMKKKLSENHDFTAVFAIADTMAIGAMRAIHEAGLNIPGDVAVAGFDGIDMGAFMTPSLTTIRQPFVEMAHKASQIIFNKIKKGGGHDRITMDATLCERESV